MRKIIVLGAFGYVKAQLDGQTIKTRNVYDLLSERHEGIVKQFDTLLFRKKPWLVFPLFWHLITCNTLVLIPCRRNLTYVFPVVYVMSKIFRFSIVSICVGGWQVEYFLGSEQYKPHPRQLRYSRNVKAFLPEMETLNKTLVEKLGFRNTEVFPNFRIFEPPVPKKEDRQELRMVFMARINRNKGYATIFQALSKLREMNVEFSMTFYGQVADEDRDDFMGLIDKYKDVASYEGALSPGDIYRTLRNYDVLLLPTRYYTEGFPGSILDSYISGIPVIVTEWKYSHEFVEDGVSGFIVPFEDGEEEFVERIKRLHDDRELLCQMKANASKASLKYSKEAAWDVLRKYV